VFGKETDDAVDISNLVDSFETRLGSIDITDDGIDIDAL